MKRLALACLLVSTLFVSCKTTEEIKREQLVNDLNQKVTATNQSSASHELRIGQVEQELSRLRGEIEGVSQAMKQKEEEVSATKTTYDEEITQLKSKVETLATDLESLQSSIKELLDTIKKARKEVSNSGVSTKKSSAALIKEADALFQKRKLEAAKDLYSELYTTHKLSTNQNMHLLFQLGSIAQREKAHEEALALFSKIYTSHPENSKAPAALLQIGLTLKDLKQKEAAQESFKKLIGQYPRSPEKRKAEAALKSL